MKRKFYKVSCPVCCKRFNVYRSFFQKIGFKKSTGKCPYCNYPLEFLLDKSQNKMIIE